MLGIERSREVIPGDLSEKSVTYFDPDGILPHFDTLPHLVRFYRKPTTYVDVELAYFTQDGKSGSLKSKTIGRASAI